MELITVREIFAQPDAYMDKEVTVGGWIRSIRDSKTFGFIVLSDGTSFEPIQVVYHDTMENFAEISKCNVGTALIVKGTLVATPQAKQPFEIQAETVTVEGASTPDYPSQHGVSAYHFPSASAYKHLPGSFPRSFIDRVCYSSVLPGEGLCICAHSTDHWK